VLEGGERAQHEALEARDLALAPLLDTGHARAEAIDQIAGALASDVEGRREGAVFNQRGKLVDALAAEGLERGAAQRPSDVDAARQEPAQDRLGFIEQEDAIGAPREARQQRQLIKRNEGVVVVVVVPP
jgi:hypothetical protein